MFRALRAEKILDTAEQLHARVRERFPDSSLAVVSGELRDVAAEANRRCRDIARPNLPLLLASRGLAALGVVGVLFVIVYTVRLTDEMWRIENFIAEVEAGLGAVVFLGAAVVFLVTLEQRVKRNRVLEALSELRALAHVVDMHQLTKDPEVLLMPGPPTDSSTDRTMTAFELSRYLDYCTELLSLLSKIAALYVQALPDPMALEAVDQVESLTTGLSRKIWQKIVVLDRYLEPDSARRRPPL
jgi:hypothetical protein